MNIVHITAGAGGMYCGACLHDIELVRGLSRTGQNVTMVPLYTPMKTDLARPRATTPIFYGGITVGLEQMWPPLGRLPEVIRRVLNHPRLLSMVSRLAVATRPEKLGPMTVSVLAGRDGRQQTELDRLLDYMEQTLHPDIVHLTNSLLSAVAEPVHRRLGASVVCSLQGEDVFIGQLGQPHTKRATELVRRHARHVDLFIAPGSDYADRMARWLEVPPSRVRHVAAGLQHDRFPTEPTPAPTKPVVGYLSRIAPEKGLDLLVDAFIELAPKRPEVVLEVAGLSVDKPYDRELCRRIHRAGLAGRVHFAGELDFRQKVDFLRGLSLLVLPSRQDESRGMAALEGLACGIPVLVPARGIFPEIARCSPALQTLDNINPPRLASAITSLLDDIDQLKHLRIEAARSTRAHFDASAMVDKTLGLYRGLVDRSDDDSPPQRKHLAT